MAESEGFEPSMEFLPYALSRGAPSATRPTLRNSLYCLLLFNDPSGHAGTRVYSGLRPSPLRGQASPAASLFFAAFGCFVSHSANSPVFGIF